MAKTVQFTKEEIKQIDDLRVDVSNIFTQLGQIVVEKKRRLKELEENESKLLLRQEELVVTEQSLFRTLNDKYGDGNYDPETGIFTPATTIKNSEKTTKDTLSKV